MRVLHFLQDKIYSATFTNTMGPTNLTATAATAATAATITLPTTSVPIKYLIIATFNVNNAGFSNVRDIIADVRSGGTMLRQAQYTAASGDFVNSMTVNVIHNSSGGAITLTGRVSAAGGSPLILNTSHYSVTALGAA